MAPPAKRRKRNIVADEEDEGDERPQPPKKNSLQFYFSSPDKGKPSNTENNEPEPVSPSPIRKSTRSSRTNPAPTANASNRRQQFNLSSTKSPSQSPAKPKPKKQIEEKGKSANIRTLFSKQSQKVRTEGRSNGIPRKTEAQSLDITSDPLSDDEEVGAHRAMGTSLVGKRAQKRTGETFESATLSSAGPFASQRFIKPSRLDSASFNDGREDQRPWSERFGPVSLDELVVHKKKVADVRAWLDQVLSGRMRQRLLILKGSAGTGKTTTMHLLAKDMGFEVLEWRNPTGSSGAAQGLQSASAQFEEFMGRGNKFGQLEFIEDESAQASTRTSARTPQDPQGEDHRRIILIEEFPNTFMRSGSALTSFRRTILQFLAANTPSLATFGHHASSEPVTPIVMIISETLLTTTSASADSFTAHRLLGPEILRHPGTGIIEFNDVAPTLLIKALETIVKKEARMSGRRRTPGPQVLKRLAEIGDVRSAISSLEFLCLKGDDNADWGSSVAFAKTKKTSKDLTLTKGEQESLQLISQREASLGIFHAVGKVVYNKRDEQPYCHGSEEALAEQMPPHMTQCSRPKRSQVSVDTLIDETGTDTSTFISALHENYVISCEQTGLLDSNSSIDYINGCIEYLSESDLLNPSWDIFFGGKGFNMGRDQGSHILRQDEMAFETAVRGLLFSLPCPVKRKSTSTGTSSGRGGDAFKMYYPTSIKLWRTKEELEGLVDMWASKTLKGEEPAPVYVHNGSSSFIGSNSGPPAFRKDKPSSVGDWVGNRSEMKYATKETPKPETQVEDSTPLLSLGNSARKEMILERLPYMAHMTRRRRTSFYSMGLRDIEKVVSFQGIGPLADEEESDADADEVACPAGELWATDKPTEDASPKKKRTAAIRSRSEQSEGSMISSLQNKLVLSDDDIEDEE
ncbi:Cell cycle checkpoint protein RAD17 [Cytospora mali]|uniref:Cell cycle checkpoint protein RAD17 n=1 Tax=Cytospora mali TaxID=578113 RepID=A0A194VP34_CYTMA|nr:Cell cycle checkpoint protein RAD17 [Valsa mali]